MQQVQASEGTPALIQVGQSVPLTSSQTDSYGDLRSQTEYRNVTQGSTSPPASPVTSFTWRSAPTMTA
jgi:hypothetical protein